jgi:hypothetical protein
MSTTEYDADGNWLIDHLMEKMDKMVEQGAKRGKWLENMTQWNYSPEFLIERGLVHPLKAHWLSDSFEERTFTLSMPMSPELMKKVPETQLIKYFDQAIAMRESFIQWLKEIPQMVDIEKHIIRWPMQLDFSYSGCGQQIHITLISHHVKLDQ